MSAPPQNNPQARNKRSRIVINLEGDAHAAGAHARAALPPTQAAHIAQGAHVVQGAGPLVPRAKRRRWPVVLGVTGGVLLLAALGAFIYWQNFKTKPAYSLALAIDAARRNDGAAFDQVFDTDKVVAGFAPQVIDEATGRLGNAVTPAMRKRIEAAVPLLIPKVRDSVRGEVMRKVRELTKRAEGKPFFMLALAIPYIADIKQDGDGATIAAKVGERDIELSMKREAGASGWKVVAVKDQVLARRLVDDLARDLPAIGGDVLDEARRRILGQLRGVVSSQ